MAELDPRQEGREFSEESESLLRITLAPALWAIHFVVSYASTAVYCAKWAESAESILGFRIGIGIGTALVLAFMLWLGWQSWRQWDANVGRSARQVLEELVEEHEGRHNFLGHAAFLLTIISFVGVIYTALPVALIGNCR